MVLIDLYNPQNFLLYNILSSLLISYLKIYGVLYFQTQVTCSLFKERDHVTHAYEMMG